MLSIFYDQGRILFYKNFISVIQTAFIFSFWSLTIHLIEYFYFTLRLFQHISCLFRNLSPYLTSAVQPLGKATAIFNKQRFASLAFWFNCTLLFVWKFYSGLNERLQTFSSLFLMRPNQSWKHDIFSIFLWFLGRRMLMGIDIDDRDSCYFLLIFIFLKGL